MRYKLRDTVTKEIFNQVTFHHQQVKSIWYERFSTRILTGYKGWNGVVTDGYSIYGYDDDDFNALFEEVGE